MTVCADSDPRASSNGKLSRYLSGERCVGGKWLCVGVLSGCRLGLGHDRMQVSSTRVIDFSVGAGPPVECRQYCTGHCQGMSGSALDHWPALPATVATSPHYYHRPITICIMPVSKQALHVPVNNCLQLLERATSDSIIQSIINEQTRGPLLSTLRIF